jgi:DNA-binding transcriptional LysR family regulator
VRLTDAALVLVEHAEALLRRADAAEADLAEEHPGIAVRAVAGGSLERTIFLATRTADATRPSVQALRNAVRVAAAALGDR